MQNDYHCNLAFFMHLKTETITRKRTSERARNIEPLSTFAAHKNVFLICSFDELNGRKKAKQQYI